MNFSIKDIKYSLRILLAIFIVDIVFITLMFLSAIGDESPSEMRVSVYNITNFLLKNVLSFPANIINKNFPFFLENARVNKLILILFVMLNSYIQSWLIIIIKKIFTVFTKGAQRK